MSAWLAAAALALAAVVVGAGGRRDRARRLTGALPVAPDVARSRPRAPMGPAALARLVAVLAGVATAVIVGGWPGVGLGFLVGAGLDHGLRRLEPRAVREERVAVVAALPFAADLLGAVLRSGAPTARGVAQVAGALGGPLGARLDQVARALQLGAPAAEAWEVLAGVPAATPLVRAAVRADESGAALAGACARLAAAQRAGQDAGAEAAARRAGVLVVLPLGCCFLPAFVLIGVVPVVLGVLDGVLL